MRFSVGLLASLRRGHFWPAQKVPTAHAPRRPLPGAQHPGLEAGAHTALAPVCTAPAPKKGSKPAGSVEDRPTNSDVGSRFFTMKTIQDSPFLGAGRPPIHGVLLIVGHPRPWDP